VHHGPGPYEVYIPVIEADGGAQCSRQEIWMGVTAEYARRPGLDLARQQQDYLRDGVRQEVNAASRLQSDCKECLSFEQGVHARDLLILH
jgi:hypothetical protein